MITAPRKKPVATIADEYRDVKNASCDLSRNATGVNTYIGEDLKSILFAISISTFNIFTFHFFRYFPHSSISVINANKNEYHNWKWFISKKVLNT